MTTGVGSYFQILEQECENDGCDWMKTQKTGFGSRLWHDATWTTLMLRGSLVLWSRMYSIPSGIPMDNWKYQQTLWFWDRKQKARHLHIQDFGSVGIVHLRSTLKQKLKNSIRNSIYSKYRQYHITVTFQTAILTLQDSNDTLQLVHQPESSMASPRAAGNCRPP